MVKGSNSGATSPALPKRDIHLLKHMLFLFFVFVIVWTPIYVLELMAMYTYLNPWIFSLLRIPAVISGCIMVFDLFRYNHEVRQYIVGRILQVFRCR